MIEILLIHWDSGWNERGKKIEMYSIDHVFQKRKADWGKRGPHYNKYLL